MSADRGAGRRRPVVIAAAALLAAAAIVLSTDPARRIDPRVAESVAARSGSVTASGAGTGGYDWRIPAWAPPPAVPIDNPMSEAKVRLGRHLFYDKRLSRDGSLACAGCHDQARAFTDGRALGLGIRDETGKRNPMGLANVGYLPVLTWANPNLKTLELQALVPIFGEHPTEMGMAGREQILFARLAADPVYPPMFRAAFPEAEDAISLATVTRALAAFQRTLISLSSPYDRYRYGGEPDAISAEARRGEEIFFSHRAECYHCHSGFTFTDNLIHARSGFPEVGFHNNALYNLDGAGAYPPGSSGLAEFTGLPADVGRFRTPSLRNVAVTAPYMHDGSIATLEAVIEHYSAGGRTVPSGPHAGDGSASPLRDSLIVGPRFTDAEKRDLIAFLESLTDRAFLTDPRFANPWRDGPNARPDDRTARFPTETRGS